MKVGKRWGEPFTVLLLLNLFICVDICSCNVDRSNNNTMWIGKLAVVSLSGSDSCDYSAGLTIDNTTFQVTMDTGSSALAVATPHCCPAAHPSYDGVTTSTTVGMKYGSGSWSGYTAHQPISLGEVGPFEAPFGAMYKQSTLVQSCSSREGMEYSQGIFGLSFPTSIDDLEVSWLDVACRNGVPNGFAVQLCGYAHPDAEEPWDTTRFYNRMKYNATFNGTDSVDKHGNFWLGGYDSSFTDGDMKFAKVIQKNWYQVNIVSFSVDGVKLDGIYDVNSPHAIVDTGTTDLIINSESNLEAILNGMRNSQYLVIPPGQADVFWNGDACVEGAYINTSSTATGLSVEMEASDKTKREQNVSTVSVPFPIRNLFPTCKVNKPGLQFRKDRLRAIPSIGTILGETLLRGYVVFFDRGENSQVGFSMGKNCTKEASAAGIDVLAPNGYCFEVPSITPLYLQWPYLFGMVFGSLTLGSHMVYCFLCCQRCCQACQDSRDDEEEYSELNVQ